MENKDQSIEGIAKFTSNVDTDIGSSSDVVAADDTGSYSLFAFIKRILGKIRKESSSVTALSSAFTSTAGAIIIDADPTRLGYIISNCEPSGGQTLYLRHHATNDPTTTNYDIQLAPGQSFSMNGDLTYTGAVRGRYGSTPTNGARATRFFA